MSSSHQRLCCFHTVSKLHTCISLALRHCGSNARCLCIGLNTVFLYEIQYSAQQRPGNVNIHLRYFATLCMTKSQTVLHTVQKGKYTQTVKLSHNVSNYNTCYLLQSKVAKYLKYTCLCTTSGLSSCSLCFAVPTSFALHEGKNCSLNL